MHTLMYSPFIIPLAGIALAAFAILVSAFVKMNKAKYQNAANQDQQTEFHDEFDRIKERVKALESIVVNLDQRVKDQSQ